MSHVQFDDFKTRVKRTHRRDCKLLDDRMDIADRHFTRRLIPRRKSCRARPDHLPPSARLIDGPSARPGQIRAGLATGVGQLNRRHTPLLPDKCRDPFERLGMFIRPNPAIRRRYPPLRRDCGSFHTHQRRPADGTAAQMHQVPVGGHSIVAGVLAHRRDKNTVL